MRPGLPTAALRGRRSFPASITSPPWRISIRPSSWIREAGGGFYDNRGFARISGTGEVQPARLDYDKAIELNPRLVEAYNHRGNLLHDLGVVNRNADLEKMAIADYDKAIKIKCHVFRGVCVNRGLAKYELCTTTTERSPITR